MTVNFSADLNLLARRVQTARPRMRDISGVAKTRDALTVQQMRVDTRDLRRDVGAQAERCVRTTDRPA